MKEVQNRLVKFFYIVKLGRLDILKCVSQENNKRQEISKKFPLKLFQETNKYGRKGAESSRGKNSVKNITSPWDTCFSHIAKKTRGFSRILETRILEYKP